MIDTCLSHVKKYIGEHANCARKAYFVVTPKDMGSSGHIYSHDVVKMLSGSFKVEQGSDQARCRLLLDR
jgi:hypothetical protein